MAARGWCESCVAVDFPHPGHECLMQKNGIRARHKRRYKVTADSKHNLPVAANLLNRNFTPSGPNLAWTSDITYPWTDEGWLYLAIVFDLFNREVVGWSLKPRMTADIVPDALTMAWFHRKPASGSAKRTPPI
ncbi:DDE-type integrase/transposase/recombinase [Candidatus Methylospira mobilis]|uniref:DDE-type integrase/transposase/recombinase n=1 Tax=Candidatus Methylospira mobilis TaxID=1808979 RepID=A0A5Q0BFC0_9GAMM|nr:DDE-type integrase/transposase/recombinase [Candidatus Methylospira mobilis]